ncbi:MAG: hypothetical protein IJO03_03135 [Clostridia bacterium]|nr:hypothetical protein [Clostridia bacterium]MBQ7121239.1 hypothetical protein [Clostridia bacterium]
MSKKNIITSVVAGLALMLVVVVVLVETGVISSDFSKEPETVIESEIIVVSETNEFGDVEYLTMVTRYSKPKVSSNHRYPTKKTTTKKPTTTKVKYVEQSSFVHVTDPDGIPQFNPDGSPVTEVVTYTVREDSITKPTTAAPKTSAVVVTDEGGNQQTDASGNAVTEVVTYHETTTKGPDIWSENTQEGTTGGGFNIETDVKRDDNLAQAVVDQINADRAAEGLEPLEHATGLKATARTNSTAMALPDLYGGKLPAADAYTLKTTYGGSPVYQTVAAANRSVAMSPDTTKIGVGVVIYEGQYYTTVIFR